MRLMIKQIILSCLIIISGCNSVQNDYLKIIMLDSNKNRVSNVMVEVSTTIGEKSIYTSNANGEVNIPIDCKIGYLISTDHKNYYTEKLKILEPCPIERKPIYEFNLKPIEQITH